jgi:Mor family transcriptional regulator
MYQLPKHLWPPKLLEIAEYCGDKAAMDLLQHYGGGHLCVPRQVDAMHRLSQVLGVVAAAVFCQNFAGETIQIPKAARAFRALRNAEIRQLRQEGEPLFNLARRFGLTERQIMTICNGMDEDCGQVDLFDAD